MNEVYVAGVSMTPFGKQLHRSTKDLATEALRGALADAGAEQRQIQAVFYGNCVQGHMEGQDMVRGEIALREAGIEKIPVVNVENACATGSTAFHLAASYVLSGACDIALAIGVEKMFSRDKALMFSAFDGAWDVHGVARSRDLLLSIGDGVPVPPGSTSDKPYSVFMDVYAGLCRLHMKTYGTTQRQPSEQLQQEQAHLQAIPAAWRGDIAAARPLAATPSTSDQSNARPAAVAECLATALPAQHPLAVYEQLLDAWRTDVAVMQ